MNLNKISAAFERWRRECRQWVELTPDDMHDYQNMAKQFILDTPWCALFIGLGLGKTVISASAAIELLFDDVVKRVLVIAPLKVANRTWPDEFKTWSHLCTTEISLLTGDELQRKRAMRSRAPVHIINRENIEWLALQYKSKWPYDMVIIDESSSFKSHTSNRFKALKNVRRYIKRMVQLTATPVSESYMALFSQIYLLDGGERFGRFVTKFQQNYFNQNVYSRKFTLREGADKEIMKKISDICLVMESKDYLDMKEAKIMDIPVQLTKAQQEQYKEMSRDSMMEVILENGGSTIIEAETAAALTGKLLQMASGFIYETTKRLVEKPNGEDQIVIDRKAHILHNQKLDKLEALVEDLHEQGENIVVVYHFKPSLERLMKRFPKGVVMDKAGNMVTTWNKGKIPLLFIHAQSAGHGLNMQKGGRVMVFYDIPWSLELYLQVIGRLDRQGQKRQVLVYHLVATGTDDSKVVVRLREKRDTQDWLFRRLRAMQKKRRRELLRAVEEEL
ncbi:putative ATP-dependent helicase [Aeromonas phage BUCT552]|nr:putative ATP-dependent helicase [Aeromonas phage BUCT552]